MGLMASFKCTSCGLKADRLGLGVGMALAFNFVSSVLSYCPKCRSLTDEPRFQSAHHIRAAAEHLKHGHPDGWELAHLAEAIATAIERKCRKCGTKQKTVRYSDSDDPVKCPRCSKKTLQGKPLGIFD